MDGPHLDAISSLFQRLLGGNPYSSSLILHTPLSNLKQLVALETVPAILTMTVEELIRALGDDIGDPEEGSDGRSRPAHDDANPLSRDILPIFSTDSKPGPWLRGLPGSHASADGRRQGSRYSAVTKLTDVQSSRRHNRSGCVLAFWASL